MSLRAMTASEGAGRRDFASAPRVFYGLGAQKAGTTWLDAYLRSHPDAHLAPAKEVHFWDSVYEPRLPYYRKSAEETLRRNEARPLWSRMLRRVEPRRREAHMRARLRHAMHFGDAPELAYQRFVMSGWSGESVVGEISPGYALLDREGFEAMEAAKPDARYIFIMREPADRLWSAMRHYASRNPDKPRGTLNESFEAALDAGAHSFRMSDYASTIDALESVVPADRIAYFFYETLFSSDEIDRLCRFLGIERREADFGERVNPGREAKETLRDELRTRAWERFAGTYRLVESRFGAALPEAWRAGSDHVREVRA